jgi:hypothetical protein
MGYALWTDGDTLLAQGKHEYRPYGQAFAAAGDLFRERLFRRGPQSIPDGFDFVGYFASLGDLNDFLVVNRQSSKPKRRQAKHAITSTW